MKRWDESMMQRSHGGIDEMEEEKKSQSEIEC